MMEDNKKKPLSEEELEKVTGGEWGDFLRPIVNSYKCSYCDETFSSSTDRDKHEAVCSKKSVGVIIE